MNAPASRNDTRRWEDAGLYEPTAPGAEQRLELLEWLTEQGVPIEAMVDVCACGQLGAVAGDLRLRPGRRLTLRDAAAEAGIPMETAFAVHRSTGMPPTGLDEAVYTEGDLELFRLFGLASQIFSPAELGHFTRVVGNAMRRIAEAASEMFLRDIEAPLQSSGQDGSPLAVAKATLAGIELAHMATGLFDPLFRAHLELSTQTVRGHGRASATTTR